MRRTNLKEGKRRKGEEQLPTNGSHSSPFSRLRRAAPTATDFRFRVALAVARQRSSAVAMELLGEYVGLDGQRQQLRVSCEVPADADPYEALLSGVAQMRELVAELFGPLVEQEAQDRVAAAPEESLDGEP